VGAAAVLGFLIVPGRGPAFTLGAEALQQLGLSSKSVGKREKSLAEIAAGAVLPLLTKLAINQATALWQRFKEQHQTATEEPPEPRYSFRPR
jgi:hypothetical protein